MIISVPRERKDGERRVALTPDTASLLLSEGHSILVEKGAGELSGFSDEQYRAVGVEIAESLEEVWCRAEVLMKVKEPAPEEFQYFRPGLAVFSFLHPAVAPEMTKRMLEKEVIGIDYDLVMLEDGRLPILEPMSVVAGKLSIQCGAYSLQAHDGGRGVLLGGIPGVQPAKVVVVGGGSAGTSAVDVALGMGADVTVLDINPEKLSPFATRTVRPKTVFSTPNALSREILEADLVIGAVLIPGALAPKLLTNELLLQMKPGAVIVDICIDQGGFAESSQPTSISDPTYLDTGIVHYCVPNMPALVPRTSTLALATATLRWIRKIAALGISKALFDIPALSHSVVTYKGQLTNLAIGEALGIKAVPSVKSLQS